MLSEIYQKKFEKDGSFEVILATSGTEAIKKAKEKKPDLILLDLVLPEMDGFDVLEELRKDSNLDSAKIIPFSNLSQEDNKKRLNKLGADGFISKSEHTPQQLVVEVIKILKETEKKMPLKNIVNYKLRSNNFSVEDQKRVLIIEDEEVFLEVFGNKLQATGYEVERVSIGKEGQALLAQKNFGLVVVDIVLPDIEAKKIITDFKVQFPKSKTQFIVLTSESDQAKDIDELKKIGVQAIVDKNKINPDQFVEGIEEMLK